MRRFLMILCFFGLCSFGSTSLKKRVTDSLFRYEFYTTDKQVNAKPEREYFWFKGGKIHNSEYGIGGELLQDQFLKYYHNNQLAESGNFRHGLREGTWKNWYNSGALQSKAYYNKGQLDGIYISYNEQGQILTKGRYRNNKKHGHWIDHQLHDTLKYHNGEAIVKKISKKPSESKTKRSWIGRVFKGKKDSLTPATQNSRTDQVKTKKPGLLKRIFSKKNKSQSKPTVLSQQNEPANKGFFSRLFSKKNKTAPNDKS